MPTAWRSAKKLVRIMKLSQELGENVTSCYHGSKISGSQQFCLRKTFICIVERLRKSMGYRFVPECNHAPEIHTCQFFVFFCYISRTGTVCWDPEMLLPWQRDVTTSPLYWQCFEDILGVGVSSVDCTYGLATKQYWTQHFNGKFLVLIRFPVISRWHMWDVHA